MTLQQQRERDHVRELARRIAAIAASDWNSRVKQRWRDVNALRKPDRAPVWTRPGGCWAELLPEEELLCCDPWLRAVERGLRMALVKREIGDDSPVEPYYGVSASFDCDPPNTWGVDVGRHRPDASGGAWAYDPPLKTEEDFDQLRLPILTFNEERTQENLARIGDLLGDILPPQIECGPPLHSILCVPAAELRGLSQLMLDMVDAPHLVHRLMGHLRDGVLGAMRQFEATGLLTPNNGGAMVCSDPVGEPSADGCLSYRNMWCMANSQEFDPVSPRMWQEFLLEYQRPIVEAFGLSGYGCCENLTHKIDGVLSLRNLRIFVSSAWTDLTRVIDRVGDRYVVMWRLKASDVVLPDDTTAVRRTLAEGVEQLRECHYQIVLRELQTLAGHPKRIHDWVRWAIEAAERAA